MIATITPRSTPPTGPVGQGPPGAGRAGPGSGRGAGEREGPEGDAIVLAMRRLVKAVDDSRAEVRHLFDRPRPQRRLAPVVRIVRNDGGGDAA